MEKKIYYYKLRSRCGLGKQFRRLWNRCVRAERAADNFARKAEAEIFYPSDVAFAGGVWAVLFKDDVCPHPDLWQEAGKDEEGRKMWVPRVYGNEEVPYSARRNKSGLPLYIKKAIRIEKERKALPVVRTESFLQLLQADPSCGKGAAGKLHLVKLVTPTFFEYWNHIYIGIAYPCSAEELEEITQADYLDAEKAVRELQRQSAAGVKG